MKNTVFNIRQYGRTELAQLYFPDITSQSAWRKLRSWIDYNPVLRDSLSAGRRSSPSRSFTPREVALIISELGEP